MGHVPVAGFGISIIPDLLAVYLPTLLSGDGTPPGVLPVQEGLGARRVLAWWYALVRIGYPQGGL